MVLTKALQSILQSYTTALWSRYGKKIIAIAKLVIVERNKNRAGLACSSIFEKAKAEASYNPEAYNSFPMMVFWGGGVTTKNLLRN